MRSFLDSLGRLLIPLLFRLQIAGVENLALHGPVIMMFNHTNFSDVAILSVVMPRQPIGFAKEELLRNPLLGPIVRTYDAIPVRRGEVDRQALRRAQELLAEGKHVLMVAPEGHRSGDGRLQRAHDGIAYLAVRSDAVVVPVAVTGIEHLWRNVVKLRRTSAHVVVGQPFRFSLKDGKMARDVLRLMTTEAMYQLALLCAPENRGVYADVSQATAHHLDFDV
jgi:1-acyl-sn-glycerol-3-phosphate acyltransferase